MPMATIVDIIYGINGAVILYPFLKSIIQQFKKPSITIEKTADRTIPPFLLINWPRDA